MRLPGLAIAASVLVTIPTFDAQAGPFAFTTIDAPGTMDTDLVGINNAGTIVGNADRGGFIYSGGTFTALSAPTSANAVGTPAAGGINNAGTITGSFLSSTLSPYPGTDYGGKGVGFVQTGTSFTILDLNRFHTIPHAINLAGSVVGEVNGPGPGSIGPFTLINGVRGRGPTDLTDTVTYAGIRDRGINDAGDIVGTYHSTTGDAGFLVKDGTTTKLVDPDGISTNAYGVNNLDQVAGNYVTGRRVGFGYVDIRVHGFVLTGGTYTSIDVPGAVRTMAAAINDLGMVVGTYVDGEGSFHGFLATPVTDVPEPASALLLGGGLLAWLASRRAGRARDV